MRQMRELVKLGVEVHAALPDQGGLWSEYYRSGIQTHLLQTDFPIRHPWLFIRRATELLRLVENVQPDIVHSHFVGTTLTMRLALRSKRKLPRIFQVPGPLHLEQFLFRKSEIAIAQNNDYWIGTCSYTQKCYIQSGLNPKRVFCCFYGTYVEDILKRKQHGRLRRELGIPRHTPLVGMVAFIYKPKRIMGKRRGIKGHEDLIDALALAVKKVPDLKVVFIGGPWDDAYSYEKQVKAYAAKYIPERAYFLGTRSDVPELYADFDVAVHPSHSENLGGAGESLLLGVPTIATNVGGFPDIVKPGLTGYLVPPKQPEKLSVAVIHALQHKNEALRLAANGSKQILENNDVRRTAKKILQIYQTILKG